MTLKQYLFLMSVATGICWLAWLVIVWSIDPTEAGFLGMLFFYVSLFLAVVGTFSVLGFLVKRRLVKDEEIIFRHVKRTFRQSLTVSSFLILLLFLRGEHLLTWWNALLLILLLVAIEGIIFSNRKFSNRDYV